MSTDASPPLGMPLLSGPIPPSSSSAPSSSSTSFLSSSSRADLSCRKCNKEFNVLFTRAKRCNHCGYSYCSTCADYQALMPRVVGVGGSASGYDPMPVCAFCIEHLTITASGRAQLRAQPISKLKKYMQAYNLPLSSSAVEKDDVVNAIIAARESNGCLPRRNEEYYRRYSVPSTQSTKPRSLFARATGTAPTPPNPASSTSTSTSTFTSTSSSTSFSSSATANSTSASTSVSTEPWRRGNGFARPDLEPDAQRPGAGAGARPYAPYVPRRASAQGQGQGQGQQRQGQGQGFPGSYPGAGARPRYTSTPTPTPTRPPTNPPRPPQYQYQYQYQNQNQQRPRAPAPPVPSTPPPPQQQPTPPLSSLLTMSHSTLSSLPTSTLKQILYENHVIARLALEKSELVARVWELVEAERVERARREEEERVEREWERERVERERTERERTEREWVEREEREREENQRVEGERVESEREQPRRIATVETVQDVSEMERGHMMDVDEEKDEEGDAGVRIEGDKESNENSATADPSSHSHALQPTPPSSTTTSSSSSSSLSSPPSSPKPPPTTTSTHNLKPAAPSPPTIPERTGLCVVCQDEEANIAIVDCGHLALCRSCSEAVMASSRECPLCRTRIVTEARLLRIFKT